MIDSRIKLLVSAILIIALTVMEHWYFPIIISILCIVISIKLDMIRDYSKRLIFPLILGLFILAIQSFTYGINKVDLFIFPVYMEGLNYGFLIFSRVMASASVLILAVTATSENEVLENMRWFRIPQTMIEISSFMTRYIKTFSHEGKKLKLAQESRCGFSRNSGFANRIYNIASICGLLIIRASARSEEIYRAMLARAWRPGLKYAGNSTPLRKGDILLGFVLISGIIGLTGIDRVI